MQYTKVVNLGQSGLSTVGFTLYDKDGAEYQARTTTGVVELGASGVYSVKLDVPDMFDGILVWDDGNAEALYAGESFNNFQVNRLSTISDRTEYILQSIAMHRSEVEPIIAKMDIKSVLEQFEKVMEDIKAAIKTFEIGAKAANDDVKAAVKNIKIPEQKQDIVLLDKHLRMVEALYSDYNKVMDGMRKIEKSLQAVKSDTAKQVRNEIAPLVDKVAVASESLLTSDEVKKSQAAISKKFDEQAVALRARISTDFDQIIKKLGAERFSVLKDMLGILEQSAYRNSPSGAENVAFTRKMSMMLGRRK